MDVRPCGRVGVRFEMADVSESSSSLKKRFRWTEDMHIALHLFSHPMIPNVDHTSHLQSCGLDASVKLAIKQRPGGLESLLLRSEIGPPRSCDRPASNCSQATNPRRHRLKPKGTASLSLPNVLPDACACVISLRHPSTSQIACVQAMQRTKSAVARVTIYAGLHDASTEYCRLADQDACVPTGVTLMVLISGVIDVVSTFCILQVS
jgi:hypothetical protein